MNIAETVRDTDIVTMKY